DGSGLIELHAANQGDADVAMPREVSVRWVAPSRLVAADALVGMQADRKDDGVTFRSADGATGGRLRPGERRSLGWLRLERDTEVAIDAH
ncbi:MAG: hypothetical protein ACKPEA_09165, partial [Planctomycetota bacterium]